MADWEDACVDYGTGRFCGSVYWSGEGSGRHPRPRAIKGSTGRSTRFAGPGRSRRIPPSLPARHALRLLRQVVQRPSDRVEPAMDAARIERIVRRWRWRRRRLRPAEQRDDRIAAEHSDLRHRAWCRIPPAQAEPLQRIEQRQRQGGRALRHQRPCPFRQRTGPDHDAGAVAVLTVERRLLRRRLARRGFGSVTTNPCAAMMISRRVAASAGRSRRSTKRWRWRGRVGAGDSLLFSASACLEASLPSCGKKVNCPPALIVPLRRRSSRPWRPASPVSASAPRGSSQLPVPSPSPHLNLTSTLSLGFGGRGKEEGATIL